MRISKPQITSVIVLLVVVVVAAYVSRAGDQTTGLESAVGSDIYEACGLNKLSPDEAGQLFDFLRTRPCYSFLQESAVNFLDAEGYRRVLLIGYGQFDLLGYGTTEEYLIAHHAGKQYILDPPLSAEPVTPGLYWAKETGSRWNIVLPSGKDEDYWVKQVR